MADVMHGSRLALPISLELRAIPSRTMAYASPLIALALTMVFGLLLFALLGKDPVAGLRVFLVEPLVSKRAIGEVLLKTVPLVLCALGLSVCYRANVWNIGAEGQLIVGGIFAAATIIYFDTPTPAIPGAFALVLAIVAGLIGGALWAAITALLRDRFHANEILVSLMLTYIAQLLLLYVVNGPLKDPNGMNFPQSIVFDSAFVLPTLVAGTRLHVGFLFMLVMTAAMTLFVFRSFAGYRLQVGGLAPQGRALCGFLVACGAVDGAAGVRRPCGYCRRLRGHGADRATAAIHFSRLRLCRYRCGVRRPLESGGHRAGCDRDVAVLYRWRACAIAPGPAIGHYRSVPGDAAVLPARLRHAHRIPPALARTLLIGPHTWKVSLP